MSRTLDDTYFTVTPIHMWSYLGFYKHRYHQDDFSYLFESESFRLMKTLEQDSREVQDKANILITGLRVKYYNLYYLLIYIAHAITCSMGIPSSWKDIQLPRLSGAITVSPLMVYGSLWCMDLQAVNYDSLNQTREGRLRFPFRAMLTGLSWIISKNRTL
ncbi:hypothetical protein C1646_92268 [Rhizophagus diaphanus]|nr:hypothetical protein C1646_92268 [Rhizophagus diaphanus] [Rhizophagus sp. MUCL 43196]